MPVDRFGHNRQRHVASSTCTRALSAPHIHTAMAMCLTSVGDVYALPSRTRRRGGARSPLICQVASMQPQVALCLTSVSSLQGLPQPRLSPASASAACARRGRHKRSEGRLAAKEALPVAQTSAAPSDAAELDLRAASVLLLLAESFNRATGRYEILRGTSGRGAQSLCACPCRASALCVSVRPPAGPSYRPRTFSLFPRQ